jgi:hypothetical protein
MNRFLAVPALATLVATPALAQSYDPDVGTGNIVRLPTPPRRPPTASKRWPRRRGTMLRLAARPLCSPTSSLTRRAPSSAPIRTSTSGPNCSATTATPSGEPSASHGV